MTNRFRRQTGAANFGLGTRDGHDRLPNLLSVLLIQLALLVARTGVQLNVASARDRP
jgi:hypothetical protein